MAGTTDEARLVAAFGHLADAVAALRDFVTSCVWREDSDVADALERVTDDHLRKARAAADSVRVKGEPKRPAEPMPPLKVDEELAALRGETKGG
jgi:hypothetical protein